MGQTRAVDELVLIFSNRTWFKSAYFRVLRKKYFLHLDYTVSQSATFCSKNLTNLALISFTAS